MNKKYFPEIDICRGLGIILVVLGHALKQTGETNAMFQILLSFIYSFHMPLFFIVSGFVAVKVLDLKKNEDRIRYIKDKAARLLVPYFAVGIFYMPIKFVLSSFAVKPYDFSSAWKILIGENPNTVLWFLYTLFWVSVVSCLILNHKNLRAILVISGCLSIISYVLGSPIEFTKYLFFYIAGIYLRKNYDKVLDWIKGKNVFLVAVIFLIANIALYVTQAGGVTFVTAVSGSFCTLAVSRKILSMDGPVHKVISLCGKYSMDIYILSDFIATAVRILIWGILGWNYILCTIICFAVSMFLPIPVSRYIIRKVKLFRVLVLGMK